MNKILLFVAALFFCSTVDVYAQASYGPLEIGDSSEHYVFTDKAMVRALADMSASVIDTLHVGDLVFVRSAAVSKDLPKEVENQWVYVSYQKKGIVKDGYIWVGLLSFNALRRGDTKFVCGVDDVLERIIKHKEYDYSENIYYVKLKVLRNDTLIAVDTFTTDTHFTTTEITNGKGLDRIRHIVQITFGGGACGVGSYTYTYLWDGEKLFSLPKLFEVVDADSYYAVQDFVFPADEGGKPGMILWKEEIASIKDEESVEGEDIQYDIKRSEKTYTWDGTKLKFLY